MLGTGVVHKRFSKLDLTQFNLHDGFYILFACREQ